MTTQDQHSRSFKTKTKKKQRPNTFEQISDKLVDNYGKKNKNNK